MAEDGGVEPLRHDGPYLKHYILRSQPVPLATASSVNFTSSYKCSIIDLHGGAIGTRTLNPQVKSLLLYQIELYGYIK